jgi:rubredoxin-NAD+ reductase
MSTSLVIIGTGLAGYTVAKEWRKNDPRSSLTFVTTDDGAFYSKPLLSSALSQQRAPEMLASFSADEMREQLNATIITHAEVTRLDPTLKTLYCDGHTPIAYQQLVFATGAKTFSLQLEGDAADKILSVNSLADYRLFRNALKHKKKIAIIGAGLVGCEFANDLTNTDYNVDLVELKQSPLPLLIPPAMGKELVQGLKNVRWHLGCSAKALNYKGNGYTLALDDGSHIDCDLVLSAVGFQPNTQLASDAGLVLSHGIKVNEYCQSEDKSIFALGDCAEINGFYLPYVAPILHAARALAKTLAGEKTPVHYPALPVIVKTTQYPITSCLPKPADALTWKIEKESNGLRCLSYENDSLCGFALSGELIKERMALAKKIGAW